MPSEPAELILPAGSEATEVLARLAEHVELERERARVADRLVLDTFDGRLWAAGLRAERPAGRTAGGVLSLIEPGAGVRRAELASGGPLLAGDLPPGPLRDRIAPVIGVRALLRLARVRSRVEPVHVLNASGKIVVRLRLERAEAVLAGGVRVPLPDRLHAQAVRGYEKRLDRTVRLLVDELGLAHATRSLLDEAVLAAGGTPGGHSTKIRLDGLRGARADAAAGAVLSRLADVAQANVAGTIADHDSEFLHDLRVAVRRARALLRELRGVHPPSARAHVRAELRWVQAFTGPVRDLDVQLLEWDGLAAGLHADRSADLGALRTLLEQRRLGARRALVRGLGSARFAAALSDWRALASTPPAGDGDAERPAAALAIEALAADRIHAVHRRMVRDGRRIAEDSPPEALHDLRKRGKELRYLLELFGSLYPAGVVKPLVRALKDLQDVLGRFQDRAVQSELLTGLAPELARMRGGPAALMASGLVVEALRSDQHAAREEFGERFAAFAAADQRALVRATFPALAER